MPLLDRRAPTRHPRSHRRLSVDAGTALDLARRPDFRTAVMAGVVALAALVAGSTFGDLRSPTLRGKLIALGAALVVVVSGVVAARRLGNTLAGALSLRTGRSGATAVRLVITFTGYVVVTFAALGLLAVPVQHLVLGGALTGVVVGIAAQQSLGNMFAGMVLLVTRPFSVGDCIRVRAGALGGEFDGVVRTMSLTYVTVDTDDGPLHVPNSGMLAAAVGPRPTHPDVVVSSGPGGTPSRLHTPGPLRHRRGPPR